MKQFCIPAFIAVVTLCNSSCNNAATTDKISKPEMMAGISKDPGINPDSVAFSFVFMGCNRVDKSDVSNPNTNASTANVPQLQRTFNEVAALNPKPVFYFFLGDEVLGLTPDAHTLQSQLKAWRKQYADTGFSKLPQSGIQLVAIPGNHEMLYEGKSKKGKKEELPNSAALAVWLKEMSSFVPSGITINRVGGSDSINNQLTYSFTYQNTHFILLNTDTYNTSETIGMAPAAWINADIAAARKNPAVKHIFLLGHKPAVVDKPLYMADKDDIMDIPVVQSIWPVMEANNVEAMLSAHSHQYYRTQPNTGKTYQVIAGNGGSPYEKHAATDTARQFFGYTIVYVMKNQTVMLQSMGRSIPAANYLETIPANTPTTIRDAVNISWGTSADTWQPGSK
jgi:hypothetical protein